MTVSNCTIFAESFFHRNAALFGPYLADVGLNKGVLQSPEAEIPLAQYVALWEVLGRQVSPNIGLEVGIRTESQELGAYGHAVRCAPTMPLVLRCLSHFIPVFMQGARVEIQDKGSLVSLIYQIVDPCILQRRQDAEFSLGLALSLFREVTRDAHLTPVKVEFEHQAPESLEFHRQVFGCPVDFGRPDNRLSFSCEFLELPVHTADTRLFQALEPFLEKQLGNRCVATDMLSQMSHHIASSLNGGGVSLEQVAGSMRLSVRTLQRRLAEQGLEFSQLVEGVRRSLAEDYVLKSDYSLTEIALLLGYSESSSFSRAFRRWTDLTPQQFRLRSRS